jgi:hypothetical protein
MDGDKARPNLTGGCQCGAVRYRIEATPTSANLCHCRMCQKAGGAPFMAFAGFPLDGLAWTRGAPKTFLSSAIAERGFCADCGTPLTYRPLQGGKIDVTICSLDEPNAIAPRGQLGAETKVDWLDDALALPPETIAQWMARNNIATVGARQHPDHET